MKTAWMLAAMLVSVASQADAFQADAHEIVNSRPIYAVALATYDEFDYFAPGEQANRAGDSLVPEPYIGDPLADVAPGVSYPGCTDDTCFSLGDAGGDGFWWAPRVCSSDDCYDCFISPVTNPIFFEDPRTLTEARMIFMHHQFPPALGSGDMQLLGLQVRAAVTDRLSIIATKSGFLIAGNDAPHQDGWADVAAGLKYNLFADPIAQRLLSAGLTFELPVGSTRAFQGTGDGEFNFFVTGGAQFLENWHWISATGIRAPTNTVEEAPVIYTSNHIDRYLMANTYVLFEFNTFHYLRDGQSAFTGINGIDLYNLGGRGIAGNTLVTGAFGFRWKPYRRSELGVAWELPLNSGRKDVLENRITADWILRF